MENIEGLPAKKKPKLVKEQSIRFDLDLSFSSEDEVEKKLLDSDIRLSHNDSLLLMSFRLPIHVVRVEDDHLEVRDSRSTLYPALFKLKDKGMVNFKWVGWPGIFPKDEQEKFRIQELLAEYRCYPVWIEQEMMQKFLLFYEYFMRPLFHNFKGTGENVDGDF